MTQTKFTPGNVWLDTAGNPIQAHGGGILYDQGTYYWFGENKAAGNVVNDEGMDLNRVDVIGVSCYSSTDLYNWKNEGIVLPAVQDDPAHDLHPSKVVERPKVLFNETTKQYVMWMHIDQADYTYARVGIAVSPTPTGPFTYVRSFRPNGCDSRDMTVYKDEDGSAYLLFSSEWNSYMATVQLTADYMDVEKPLTKHFVKPNHHESRESPAVFKHQNRYYLITSGCTGWASNEAEIAVADSVMGPWEVIGNPCVGAGAEQTFQLQNTFVLPLPGKENAYIFMADRWFNTNLQDSRYAWLPIHVDGGTPRVEWMDSWSLSDIEGFE